MYPSSNLPDGRIVFFKRAAFLFVLTAIFGITAKADTLSIVGNANGSLATATINCSFNSQTNTFTFTLSNTSQFDARITGVGFDLDPTDFTTSGSSGLNGFSGANVGNFTFSDGDLGNVPQFGNTVLDFGFITGTAFTGGGSPDQGIAPGGSLTFSVSGAAFSGMTEHEICSSVFVRFQRVGADGQSSDVGTPTALPEPASMFLLGSGLLGAAGLVRKRAKRRS